MSYFDRHFKGRTVHAAPVQSDENGWRDYLSRRELGELADAKSNRLCAFLIGVAGLGVQGAGVYLILTASLTAASFTTAVAAPFAFFGGAVVAIAAGATTLKKASLADKIEQKGKRREGDAEVGARLNRAQKGPTQ